MSHWPPPVATSDDTRVEKLRGYFNAIGKGKRKLQSSAEAKRFLEAVVCQDDRAACVENILASTQSLDAVRISVRMDISSSFLNKSTSAFINYLSDPAIKQLCNGTYLQRLIAIIVDPPTVVNELLRLHDENALEEQAIHALAWLVLESLTVPLESGLTIDPHSIGQKLTSNKSFINSPYLPVRTLGHKIEKLIDLRTKPVMQPGALSPGGRHDNDHADFRKISVLPTGDEVLSTEPVFYRRSDAIDECDEHERSAVHLDNQFRLLREDMLSELRLDLQVAQGKSTLKRRVTRIDGLTLDGLSLGENRKRKPCALRFRCASLSRLEQLSSSSARKKFLKDNPNYLRHQSFGCLLQDREIIAFGSLERDIDLLAANVPTVVLRIPDAGPLEKTLLAAKMQGRFQFLLVNTPIFAFAPILQRLQGMIEIPLAQELLSFRQAQLVPSSPFDLGEICRQITLREGRGLRSVLGLAKDVDLDPAQARALLSGLSASVSLLQGPPGTGKSFIGALIAKALYEHTKETVLVLSYTNHALDQFLEDLMDIGIPGSDIVRLGSKSSARTEPLKMSNQSHGQIKKAQFDTLSAIDSDLSDIELNLNSRFNRFERLSITDSALMVHLEFSEDTRFFDAFSIPANDDGMKIVGPNGKPVKDTYLIDRWRRGLGAGFLHDRLDSCHSPVWQTKSDTRDAHVKEWKNVMLQEHTASLARLIGTFDNKQSQTQAIWSTQKDATLKGRRVIGCTTTGAAMYLPQIRNAAPGIILVEEAGEILESHVLSAMTEHSKQLILIGDHKQLRPKVNDFKLTVEKGDGFNLNMSMFERLVLRAFPHETLNKQHRMPPEISAIVKHLTYPELEDAAETQQREELRGFQDRVIFFNHEHPEEEQESLLDRHDLGSKTSKRNDFETSMVLSTVRYLAQQGYGTDKIVVLTPYLGQLSLLKTRLSEDHDPVLGDLDSHDLVAAGLMTAASAAHGKRALRLSTIDNYQGEESDVVVVSLVRSNAQGDIGFMNSPQRLNVMLSRARVGLIMIGNSSTFLKSKKGANTWLPFFDFVKKANHLYDGIPVQCQRHPSRKALLQTQSDFGIHCRDGGCSYPCGAILNCGKHQCPQNCHQLYDHSKMECQHVVDFVCPKNHKRVITCRQQTSYKCSICTEDARKQEARRRRDLLLDEQREEQQRRHARRLAEIQDEIDHQKRLLKEKRNVLDLENAVKQGEQDLDNLKSVVHQGPRLPATTQPDPRQPTPTLNGNSLTQHEPQQNSTPSASSSTSTPSNEWKYRKAVLLEDNQAMDELMGMIGLDNVKQLFLDIKDRIDIAVRQDIDLKSERFSASLLGNPGTGKTTVARLYASFLTSVGALPGAFVKETTGSSLASDGVSGCKKILEEILTQGGGALFIDEAYQLASGNNTGGKAVLDFLLAEVENHRGRIVFIIAGYNKQMEDFFAHNPGFSSRFPKTFQFHDYDDEDLRQILEYQLEKKYGHRMKVEDGITGLYARIVARRIGRCRGHEGFGNARAVENTLTTIATRQASRIQQQRKAGLSPSDFFLTQADLIGPEPSGILQNNQSWTKLQEMIGLQSVKESLKALFSSMELNYDRELKEKPLIEFNLNRIFVGSPGTGKTTVAKLYGRILADLGFLSDGEVVVKTPADFVGAHLGESEKKTKAILASTVGKILVVDEAYGLYTGINSQNDPFKAAVIDTIVGDIQSTPGEDRCVLLLGYKEEMQTMLQGVNPGLSRRFPIDSAFSFDDFTDDELKLILALKLRQQGLNITDQGKRVAMKMLQRARNRPNFGNAGEVDIVLNKAKFLQQRRLANDKGTDADTLKAEDLDPDFDRGSRAATNIAMMFKDVVDADQIVHKLEGYQRTAANMRARNMDPREQLPFNFLFRGPPGTGKTTTARKMGKVYYDMEFLASAEVVECSATELVGEYTGHTGPKTQKVLERALGKVLFIDEAYRLADGPFAKEAMDEIVDCLTKEKFAQKLIVILAGYDQDINRLMSMNPGLTSRFPETISFNRLDTDACIVLLTKLMQKRKNDVDLCVLCDSSISFHQKLQERFLALSQIDNWANARDVHTIQKAIFGKLLATSDESTARMVLSEELILQEIDAMITERSNRSQNVKPSKEYLNMPQSFKNADYMPSIVSTDSKTDHKTREPDIVTKPLQMTVPEANASEAQSSDHDIARDPNVSDEVWQQLQTDEQAAKERETKFFRLVEQDNQLSTSHAKAEEEALRAKVEFQAANDALKQEAPKERNEEARRQAEEGRIRHIKAQHEAFDEAKRRAEELRIKRELARRAREEAETQRQQEVVAQKKLRNLGLCVAGFRWIKQGAGYRCAGGSHFVSDAQLEGMSA